VHGAPAAAHSGCAKARVFAIVRTVRRWSGWNRSSGNREWKLGLFRVAERQFDGERRTFADDTLDANAAVMLFDDLPANAEAQSCPAMTVLIRFLGREKRFEDQAQLLWRDSDARVGNANLGHAG